MADLLRRKLSARKARLFICACCRRIWHLFTAEVQAALVTVENYADGLADREQLRGALRLVQKARSTAPPDSKWEKALTAACKAASEKLTDGPWSAAWDTIHAAVSGARSGQTPNMEESAVLLRRACAARCDLLRDLVSPFRTIRLEPAWLTWNDACVVKLAQAIYEEHRFADLPILADALADAGCTDPILLEHCRGPGPHVRGCVVLDLLLDKG